MCAFKKDFISVFGCQDEECKSKIQKKLKREVKEVCEPKLKEDDPLSVLTAIIAQVWQINAKSFFTLTFV